MKRRAFVGMAVAVGVAGCSVHDVESVVGLRPDEETVREEAKRIDVEELNRNISSYRGDPVTYRGRVADLHEDTERKQEFTLTTPNHSVRSPEILFVVWRDKPRVHERDDIQIYGIVDGLHTYTSLVGEQTVPKIDAIAIDDVRTVTLD